jgi:predicted hydrolase (HD superfamily)
MELAEARALVKQKADKEITVRHLISVEGVMRPWPAASVRTRTAGHWSACPRP